MLQSTPAKLVASALAVVLVAMAAVAVKQGSLAAWASLAGMALYSALLVFDVDCTVMGQCNVWGWLKTVLIGLMAASLTLALIRGKSPEKPTQADEPKKKTAEAGATK